MKNEIYRIHVGIAKPEQTETKPNQTRPVKQFVDRFGSGFSLVNAKPVQKVRFLLCQKNRPDWTMYTPSFC